MILGGTGRNFAAGMSGGTAYVYDADGSFPSLLNREMVSIVQLEEEDREFLRERAEAHYRETGSAVAERLLGDWESALERFVKVLPDDYKRVMEATARAQERGEPVMEAVMAAAHG